MKMSGEMFEGKDYPAQWALNPATYQNMSNDQVDWAALAQQWIKMKETSIPPAPPPPLIVDSVQNTSLNDGGGEAPMDMDTKDDDIPPAPPAPIISGSDGWNQWNQWGGPWNQPPVAPNVANWDWNAFPAGPEGKSIGIPIPPPAPTISTNHCVPSVTVPTVPPPGYSYNTVPNIPPPHFTNQVPPSGFWNNESHPPLSGPPMLPQQPFVKSMRPNHHRMPIAPPPPNVMPTDLITSRNRDIKERPPEDDLLITIDPIKRRQLPAWIREGLEKMEKEKLRAVEREKQEILRKQELEARKKIEDEARAVLNPSKSKFDSDSEKEATEHELDDDNKDSNSNEEKQSTKGSSGQRSPDLIRPRKSRFQDASSPVVPSRASKRKEKSPDNVVPFASSNTRLSKEEMLQNLMLKVRRSLTEILLEVTNDEIGSVCKEVWKRYTTKASTGKTFNQTAGNTAPVAQITRKLGLGIYDDSSSESEEEEPSQNETSLLTTQQQAPVANENDSDDELKETLRRRQQAFRKTEAEIEARLAREEEEEEQREEEDEEDDEPSRRRSQSIERGDERRKRDEDSVRDDHSSREKKRNRTDGGGGGVGRGFDGERSRVRKDNYTGNTSCSETVDNEKDTVYGDGGGVGGNERKSSDIRSQVNAAAGMAKSFSKKLDRRRAGRLNDEGNDGDDDEDDDDNSSASTSTSLYNSAKRTGRTDSASIKDSNKSFSSRAKKHSSRHSKERSTSSSRSKSLRGKRSSSREGSHDSSRSSVRPEGSVIGAGVVKNAAAVAGSSSNGRTEMGRRHKAKRSSSSRSGASRSGGSRSRSSSRPRGGGRHKRSRSGSRRRRRASRDRSHSRTRSRSRSRSRRKRSRSSAHSHRSGAARRREDTRSRSPTSRSRRSRSRRSSSRRTSRSRRSRSRRSRSRSRGYRHHRSHRRNRDGLS